MPEQDTKGIKTLASLKSPKGDYSNAVVVQHTKNEFIFDFFFQVGEEEQLVSRIITNPTQSKTLVSALTETIKKYEEQFGPIA